MFLGHFAVGFAAKAAARRASLGTLVLAAQWLDLLWPTLLLVGAESVRIAPGQTAVTPLAFERYPISHSLLAALGWALAVGMLHFLRRRDGRTAAVLGLLTVSHWLLDAVVHEPDLPLHPGSRILVGAGAWQSVPLTLAIELPLFAAGVWLYARAARPVDRTGSRGWAGLVVFLLVVQFVNLTSPPPPSVDAVAWAGQAQWLLVLWAFWVDRHRTAGRDAPARAGSVGSEG